MTSYAELGLVGLETVYDSDRIVERFRRCHERSGSNDSLLSTFYDGTIDARCHSKVVGIDDESAHDFSVASNKKGPVDGPARLKTVQSTLRPRDAPTRRQW